MINESDVKLALKLCHGLCSGTKLSETTFFVLVGFSFVGAGFAVICSHIRNMPPPVYQPEVVYIEFQPVPVAKKVPLNCVASTLTEQPRQKAQSENARQIKLTTKAEPAKPRSEAPVVAVVQSPHTDGVRSNAILAAAPPVLQPERKSAPQPEPAISSEKDIAVAADAKAETKVAEAPAVDAVKQAQAPAHDMYALDAQGGGDFNSMKGVTMSLGKGRAFGNIGPYKHQIGQLIASNFHCKSSGLVKVFLDIKHDGTVRETRIDAPQDSDLFQAASNAVSKSELPPPPDWYKGEVLPITVVLTAQESK